MKKIISIFVIASFAIAALVSCSKAEMEKPTDPVNQQKEQETPGQGDDNENNSNEDVDIPEGMVLLNFSVSHEGDSPADQADDSKTSWDKTEGHKWSEGDQIRIIWNSGESSGQVENTNYSIATVNPETGTVSAVVADADYYYAVYPADVAYTLTEGSDGLADGTLSIEFGRNQGGTFADANIMAAKTAKNAASFDFKNMTSILKFSTSANCNYNKVTFAANDKAKINGSVSTNFGEPFSVESSGQGDLVTINVTEGEANTYYAAILPDIALSNGIGFKVDADSQQTGALSTASISMARNKVVNLGTIDSNIHDAWFIKADGTGKGTSWEDAGGPDRLVQLIYPTQSRGDGAGLTAAWRLHKATIYVAAGTYNIQAANGDEVLAPHYQTTTLQVTIKGGYPTGLSGTTATGQDPESNPTNFICNQTASTDHVFEVSGSNKVLNFTFDGITFPSNGSSITPGTVLDFNSSAASNITFNNCLFTDFVQSGTVNGGPVYVRGSGAATVSFSGCTFSGNNCNTGGAVYAYNSASTVSFTNTNFTGNVAAGSGGNGGFVRARAGEVNITDCVFTGLGIADGVSKTANQGGALYIDGATVNISGGSIKNCYASNSGAIYFSNGSLNMDGMTISNCKTSAQGGGIYVTAAGKVATIKNCTFTGLSAGADTGGGAIYSKGIVTLDNSTVESCSAENGGAIYNVSGGELTIQNGSSLISNDCTTNGGAIYSEGIVTLDNSAVESCSAENGGAIYNVSGGELTIQNGSSLITNDCTTNGGAIYSEGVVTLDNSTVESCSAKNGGAIYNVSGGELTIQNGSSLITNDCTTNGGSIYNAGNLIVDGSTVTGKGKSTDLTALLGGGIYNKSGATATLRNSSIIQGCAITGSSHHGAGIWNAGVLNIDGCTIQNNKNTQRGAGIYGVGTACDITVTDTDFDDNDAANGGAMALDDGASAYINSCSFTGSDATNGAALRTCTNSGTNVNKIIVFNSLFSGNTATGNSGTQDGATIQGYGYCEILLANCTIKSNINGSTTSAVTTKKYNSADYAKLYVISCTMSDNSDGHDFLRTSNTIEIFNSILMGSSNTEHSNVKRNYSIINSTLYSTTNTKAQESITFALGTFANGVYPLDSSYASFYGAGMSSTDLQKLTFNNITLTSEQTALLAKDQKGNAREGAIMGAYVLTE